MAVSLTSLAAVAAAAPQPIAVLDFQIPTEGGHQWDWAGAGLADLLQIEFERLGLVTLDRDFIQAVLAEQRLAADSRHGPEPAQAGEASERPVFGQRPRSSRRTMAGYGSRRPLSPSRPSRRW